MNTGKDADWLLDNLLRQVPHTRSAVLVAADGIPRAHVGLSEDHATYFAATAAALVGATSGMDTFVDGASEGRMRQIVVEHDHYLAIYMAAGQGTILAVNADRERVNAAHLGDEMVVLIEGLREYLATPPRTPATHRDTV